MNPRDQGFVEMSVAEPRYGTALVSPPPLVPVGAVPIQPYCVDYGTTALFPPLVLLKLSAPPPAGCGVLASNYYYSLQYRYQTELNCELELEN